MSEPPRVRPVSLLERVVTTALVPVLMLLGERVPLSHLDTEVLGRARVQVSPLAVGLGPFITAYGLVELTALVIPRWRRWRHDTQGRVRLERWSAALGILLALVQAWSMAESLQATELVTVAGWEPLVVHTATLTGGACAMALAARWATRRGLVNGYVLWWTLPVVIDLFRGTAFRQAAVRGGMEDVALLAVVLAVAVAATVIAVAGGDVIAASVRIDDSAYRGGQTDAPRPWFPIPVSSLQPITFAGAVLMFPAVLANLKVPGMADLQAVFQRGDVTFEAVYVALIAFATLVAAALLYRPDEVSAFMRRLGSVSDETARAGTISALRRAMLPTLVYLLVLVLASKAAHGKASAVPAMVTIALATGAVVDLARSTVAHVRARDLVCVTQLHDAYAVAALRSALGAEGIDARPRGMAVLSLLQAFGPYAPVELYVRAGDAERASALLRHWAAGEAKPVASPVSSRRGAPVLWSPRTRALVLAGLGAVALVVALAPRAAVARAPAKRAAIALVRVDDAVNPLQGAREDDAPEGVSVYAAVVPLGVSHRESRSYARVSLRTGESMQAAWARLRPWLEQFPLPPGARWAWQPQTEVDDAPDEQGMPHFHVVGLQTVVLTGEPVVTTADVEDAEVGWDEQRMSPPYVLVTMSPAASDRFYHLTEEWLERRMAIVIDDHVDSAPVIRSPIRGGRVTITMGVGEPDKQLADARLLAASLR